MSQEIGHCPLPLSPAYGPLPLRARQARFSPDGSRISPLTAPNKTLRRVVDCQHEQATRQRRAMDPHRTTPAARATETQGWSSRIPDRAALTGILFVLKSGIPWEMLPQELGCGSGMTCWRRLRDWQHADVWKRLHQALLQRLQEAGQIDWERASLDSASVPAPGGRTDWQGSDESRQAGDEAPHRRRPPRSAARGDDFWVQRT